MNEENMTKIMEFNKEEQTIEILGHKIDKSYESWESFLEEMKRLTLIQNNWNELKRHFKKQTIELEKVREDISTDTYIDRKMFLKEVLNKMQELEKENG